MSEINRRPSMTPREESHISLSKAFVHMAPVHTNEYEDSPASKSTQIFTDNIFHKLPGLNQKHE